MIANLITFLRVLLCFLSIMLLNTHQIIFNHIGLLLIPTCMLLDALDGYVARRMDADNAFGDLYDILGDRIISYSFFIFFTQQHQCPLWICLLIISRGLILDTQRTIHTKKNEQVFDKKKNSHIPLYQLSAHRFSRALYNTLKILAFSMMGINHVYHQIDSSTIQTVLLTTVICAMIRSLPSTLFFLHSSKSIHQLK